MPREFVVVQGEVRAEPEIRITSDGNSVANLIFYQGGIKIEASCWGELAERVCNKIKVGDSVRVIGEVCGQGSRDVTSHSIRS